jgi:hypothetical protein
MLSVAPVSTKYQSFVNSSVRKINPAFEGKCIVVAVAWSRKRLLQTNKLVERDAIDCEGELPKKTNY